MNVADTEIVRAILMENGHVKAASVEEADLILVNTCAIRENAEAKIWHRLGYFNSLRRERRIQHARRLKKGEILSADSATSGPGPHVGVLGCMAERLKERLLEEDAVNFVVGPDAYRDLGKVVHNITSTGQKEANTQLSLEETYADIAPVRETDVCSAFVSIMRGCNNMCSYCIVPFTRGRERSRDMASISKEVAALVEQGVKEVCLLGQNVNGFHDTSEQSALLYPHQDKYKAAEGFSNMFMAKARDKPGARFSDLLEGMADVHPELRIRFTSPHPKDFPDEVFDIIANRPNLAKHLHLPAQSGSTSMLKRMRRGYSREAYLELVHRAREKIPGVTISTDMISGFCGETEEEHQDTLSLMEEVKYDQAFLFAYSMRDKTHANRNLEDDVPEEVKLRRLQEVIDVYRRNLLDITTHELHAQHLVLVEGYSTRSTDAFPTLTGRTCGNRRVVFPANVPMWADHREEGAVMGGRLLQEHVNTLIAEQEGERERSGDAPAPVTGLEGEAKRARYNHFMRESSALLETMHAHHEGSSGGAGGGGGSSSSRGGHVVPGTYVVVQVVEARGPTLKAVPIATSSLARYHNSTSQ
jgi:MiaB/RimO family radical SAM methylthiotransferase